MKVGEERGRKRIGEKKKKNQTKRWYQEGKALEYSRFKSLGENRGNTTLRDVGYKKTFVFKIKRCMIV